MAVLIGVVSTYSFKLGEIIKKKGISKYMLEKNTDIECKTINNYCYGNLKRVDMIVMEIFFEYFLSTFLCANS